MFEYIGERIRKVREFEGISQKELGIALGLSDKAISAYESGRILPPLDTLYRISKELNKPLTYFLSDDSEKYSLHDRIDRVEKMIEELLGDLKSIRKNLVASNIEDSLVPPEEPIDAIPTGPSASSN